MKKIIVAILVIAVAFIAFKPSNIDMSLDRSITIDSLGACQEYPIRADAFSYTATAK